MLALISRLQKNNTGAVETLTIAAVNDTTATWGSITGTLSNQTDLQSALDARVPYTGATGDVNLASNKITSIALQANSSAGGELRTSSAAVALHFGSGGSANGTLYGGWNYDNGTANTLVSLGASKTFTSLSTATYPSLTEISYVKGVTSAIQTQLNGKQASGTYVTGATNSTLTLTGTTLEINLAHSNTFTADQAISEGNFTVTELVTTTGNVTNGSAVQFDTGSGFAQDDNWYYAFNVYAYKPSGGYSSTAHYIDMYDSNTSSVMYDINLSWDAVAGATYYRVVVNYDDFNGYYNDYYFDVAGTSITYQGSATTGLVNGTPTVTPTSVTTKGIIDTYSLVANFISGDGSGLTNVNHATLSNLTSGDPHSQYAYLSGRSGGQTYTGGTASGNNLSFRSTTHATKGKIIFGAAATTVYDEVNNRIGIGVASPTQSLDVAGRINIPTTTSSVGAIYQNGTRVLHTYGVANTFVGVGAGNFTFNTTYNFSNVGIGTGALSSLSGTSGHQGCFNFGLGNNAGSSITTGASNVLIGNSVGDLVTTTSGNTIIGDAAAYQSTGLNNVTYIGRGAGRSINTFTDAVFIGRSAGGTADGGLQTVGSLTNAIAIGALSYVGASNTMALGSTGAYAVDIIAGGSTASAKLHLIKTTEQLRLGYDASNYFSTTVNSTGQVLFNAVGSGAQFAFNDRTGFGTSSLFAGAYVTVQPSYGNGGANQYGGFVDPVFTPTSHEDTYGVTGLFNRVTKGGAFRAVQLIGGTFTIENTGSGTIATAIGGRFIIQNTAASTITEAMALDVQTPSTSASNLITTNYGLRIRSQKPTGVTTAYGIYAEGANDINYFAGKVVANETVRLKGYTVATLPAGTVGDTAYVTDALAPTFLAVLVGGGAITTTCFYNGTNWVAQ